MLRQQGRRHAQRCKAARRGRAAALLAALGPKVVLLRGLPGCMLVAACASSPALSCIEGLALGPLRCEQGGGGLGRRMATRSVLVSKGTAPVFECGISSVPLASRPRSLSSMMLYDCC